jgi:hypothetical protein
MDGGAQNYFGQGQIEALREEDYLAKAGCG